LVSKGNFYVKATFIIRSIECDLYKIMQVVSPELIQNKRVLLRLDLDVPIENGVIQDDTKLLSGMDTLGLCLEFATSVTICGHLGRPEGKEDPNLTVKPIVDWIEEGYGHIQLPAGKLHILENLRFEPGEDASDPVFAKELASHGDFFVFEAFSSHRPAASTTVLPTLLPHAVGLHFAQEVDELMQVRDNPIKPLVAILGGAKVDTKMPVIKALASKADVVLVGGKLAAEIKEQGIENLGSNVMVAKLNEDGFDISAETAAAWANLLKTAKEVVWNGPLGKFEDDKYSNTKIIAQAVIDSGAKSIIGGGDTISAAVKYGLIEKFTFVSVGGGAMLKLLADGTLPTIDALK
jgi:phosphoglycerate kinase